MKHPIDDLETALAEMLEYEQVLRLYIAEVRFG